MERGVNSRGGLTSGWILVTGLLLLCVTGTGLTWWNYSRQVFSSVQGVVFESVGSTGSESRITVIFPPEKVAAIRIGHAATITVGADHLPFMGRVVSVAHGQSGVGATVTIRLVDETTPVTGVPLITKGGGGKFPLPHLLPGTKCSVTIDTTVPPLDELPSK